MNNPLISLAEATQLMQNNASNIQLLEVVSDYYDEQLLRGRSPLIKTPGFIQVKTEHLEIDQVWKLKSDQELQQIIMLAGLNPNTSKHILLFDNIQFSCGTNTTRFDASARLFAVLHYYGFSNVSIILDEAIDLSFTNRMIAKLCGTTENLNSQCLTNQHQLASDEELSSPLWRPAHKDTYINYGTLTKLLAGELGPYRLLDARSAEEFMGMETGYGYVQLAGKIPTAENVINGEYQISSDESLQLILSRLQEDLIEKNIAKDDRIIWYCGTAWRASRMFALTLALGYSDVSIYEGGWNEWQQLHPEDATINNQHVQEAALSASV